MKKDLSTKLAVFKGRTIRRIWDRQKEKWYFSVVDVAALLSESSNPQVYWRVLKKRLKDEGSGETVTKCNALKIPAIDGKMRLTDVADTETILRIIQSVPSPNAEPFKIWLAKVGYERIEEIQDPELSVNRARENWQKLGRDKKWIQRRMMGQEVRNKLTDYWEGHKVKKPIEYAILTDVIHHEWSNLTVISHKELKGLKKENLRDHMTEAELVFTALAELSTRQIAESDKAVGFIENKIAGRKGGGIARGARVQLEKKTGKKVISRKNFLINRRQLKK